MQKLLLAGLLCSLSVELCAKWVSDQQAIMGTRVSVTLWHENAVKASAVSDAVMAEMRRIDAEYSPYIETSELSRMNREAGKSTLQQPFPVSMEMGRLLNKALYYGKLSEGAFDVTYATLARYYDYRERKVPSKNQHDELVPMIDYRYVQLNANNTGVHYGHPLLYIDLGGIAKGYAVDRAVEILREHGVRHANVSAGGDSRVLGDKRGQPWLIGIQNPRGKEGVAITIPLVDSAISTSGDYERFFINETGERVHHIINPSTGKPTGELASVTVLGPEGFDTDALSTTVFVLGAEKGLALINGLTGFDCIIITRKGKVLYSQELAPPENNK